MADDNYYDRDGLLITAEQWGLYREDMDYKFVSRTFLLDKDEPQIQIGAVITIWLGFDGYVAPVVDVCCPPLPELVDPDAPPVIVIPPPPSIFETTAFVRMIQSNYLEGIRLEKGGDPIWAESPTIGQRQYATEAAAYLGHAQMTAALDLVLYRTYRTLRRYEV